MATEKTPGSLWRYQGNYVHVVEWNGCLIRVREDRNYQPVGEPFLIDPEKMAIVSVDDFRDYVRKATEWRKHENEVMDNVNQTCIES